MRSYEEKILYATFRKREKVGDKIQRMNDNVLIGSVDYSKPKVQTSNCESQVEKQAEKNLKLYEEITELQKQIDEVIQIIKKIPDTTESMLLENYTYCGSWKKCMFGNPREFRQTRLSALQHFGEEIQKQAETNMEGGDK